MNKEDIELAIVKYIAGSDTPLIAINRLINFALDEREIIIKFNRAVVAKDDVKRAFGKMADDGGDHIVYSMDGGEN